jgi:hypothetical protein
MDFIVKIDRLLVFLLIAGIAAMLTRRIRTFCFGGGFGERSRWHWRLGCLPTCLIET